MSTERKPCSGLTVGAITLHIPAFTPADPELWFTLVELEFENCRITSDASRFRWVAGRLPPEVTMQVRDVIISSRSYEALKEAVIARTTPTQDQRMQQLQNVELGSRKPSELLREMQRLRGPTIGEDPLLRELWLQRLPHNIPVLLSAARKCSLEENCSGS